MKKLLDYDWSRAVQLLGISLQKCVISCNYNLKANKSIKMQSVSMTTMKACRIVHARMNCHVLLFPRYFFIIFLCI